MESRQDRLTGIYPVSRSLLIGCQFQEGGSFLMWASLRADASAGVEVWTPESAGDWMINLIPEEVWFGFCLRLFVNVNELKATLSYVEDRSGSGRSGPATQSSEQDCREQVERRWKVSAAHQGFVCGLNPFLIDWLTPECGLLVAGTASRLRGRFETASF